MLQEYFHSITAAVEALLRPEERYTLNFSAEDSDFVRFNRNQIRQAGRVVQRAATLDLIEGRRHVAGSITLSGELASDRARLQTLVRDLRERRAVVPEDPFLLVADNAPSAERIGPNRLPNGRDAVTEIRRAGEGRDLVGIYAAGGIHAGYTSFTGQRNWYSTFSYNFDWSFYHRADKAVKASYAGFEWRPEEFDRKVRWAADQFDVLKHPARTIPPGRYRVYLAPAALGDLVGILNWGGFGLKAHRTRQTPLLKLAAGEARLNPAVTLWENTREGIAPNFQEAGFPRPDRVPLIEGGAYRECLVSPRSAREYGVSTNGASGAEMAQSLDLEPGTLPADRVLQELGTGLLINNLWYLNYSDRSACRTTGMTRFATFWVEGGRIVAPLNVMRFDETIYRVLGEQLAGLTRERELILDSGTYGGRSVESARLPGALVEDFTFTL